MMNITHKSHNVFISAMKFRKFTEIYTWDHKKYKDLVNAFMYLETRKSEQLTASSF